MSTRVQFRRGTTAQHEAFAGALAELTVDIDKKTAVVHDGATPGGFPLLRADRDLADLKDIAAAVDTLSLTSSVTVNIPSDYATLQEAIDALSNRPVKQGVRIILNIESGYVIAAGLFIENGDYSHFVIRSADAEVTLDAAFPREIIIEVNNAAGPTLDCLLNAGGLGSSGVYVHGASRMLITPGSGVKNTWNTGLLAEEGANVSARGSIWTGAGVNGATGAGITAWGAIVDAEGADVSDSNYYGAQAAHGGLLNFGSGKANNAARYGVRGSDNGHIDFTSGQASNAGVYGIYAFQNSHINAPGATAINCGVHNAVAINGSTLNVRTATLTGAVQDGILVGAAMVDAYDADVSGAGQHGITAASAGSVGAGNVEAQNCSRGFYATGGAVIDCGSSDASGCGSAYYAEDGGKINADNGTGTNCTGIAVVANEDGKINVRDANVSGAAVAGIRAIVGSRINAQGANARMGASDAATDIECFNGSIINAGSSVGGKNSTLNTVSASGIIFG